MKFNFFDEDGFSPNNDERFFDELEPVMALGTLVLVALGIGLIIALV